MHVTAMTRPAHGHTAPIDVVRKLFPPRSVIHVGAGMGVGELHCWREWDVAHALLIDADAERLEWATPWLEHRPGWRVRAAVLADEAGDRRFHRASNPGEDGLLPTEVLQSFWPNLSTYELCVCNVLRLDRVLAEATAGGLQQQTPVWAIIECFPALSILIGAGEELARWSVLWLRVLLQPVDTEPNATLVGVESYVGPLGFKCIHVSESNHPAVGYALFVRDWSDQAATVDELKRVAADLSGEAQALIREKTGLTSRYDEAQRQLEALERDLEAVRRERNEAWQRLADQAGTIAALESTNARVGSEKETADREKAELEALQKMLEQQLATMRQDTSVLRLQHDELIERLAQQGRAVEALQSTNADLQAKSQCVATESMELAVRYQALEQQAADLRHEAAILRSQYEDAARRAAEQERSIEALKSANSVHRGESEALAKEKAGLLARYRQLEQRAATLVQESDALTSTVAELTNDKDSLARERNEHRKRAVELQSTVDALVLERAGLEQHLAALSGERADLDRLAMERQARIEALEQEVAKQSAMLQAADAAAMEKENRYAKLETQLAESGRRQHEIDAEMNRAEAQIDLIKDILVRGELLCIQPGGDEQALPYARPHKRLE